MREVEPLSRRFVIKRIKFINNSFYHIFNRGVDKRIIYGDNRDRLYFLYELNNLNTSRTAQNLKRKLERGSTSFKKEEYVEIVAFALMPNHYHIILKQIADKGISKYMHKLGTGYTMYFNKKNKRSGSLFEGRFKAKAIPNDEYLVHLSRYIHLNPVSLKNPDWKDKGINDKNKLKKYLEKYRWSSYYNYVKSGDTKGTDDIHTKYILEYFKNDKNKYEKFMLNYIKADKDKINDILLDERG